MAYIDHGLHVPVAVWQAGVLLMFRGRIHASDLAREHPRAVAYPTALGCVLDELHQVDPVPDEKQHHQSVSCPAKYLLEMRVTTRTC